MSTKTAPPEDIDFILQSLAREFSELRGEKVLLTGATGFFGKWITQALLAAQDRLELGLTLTLLTRNRRQAEASSPWLAARKDLEWLECDIRELPTDRRFDTILHGAAAASRDLNENQPDVMFDTIVEGTRRILQLAAYGTCKRFLFISSGAVYGHQPTELPRAPETFYGAPDPLDAKAAYGEAKRAAEFLCASHARRCAFELKIARCYAFLGPYLPLDIHFAAGNFIRDVISGAPMRIGGDGTPLRSYLYAADLVIWLFKILVHGQSIRAYNVGSDQAVSIKELALQTHEVGCEFKPERRRIESPVQIARTAPAGHRPEVYVPSVDRAREELGLEIATALPSAIRKTLAWHLVP